jgi:hypothetical protein
MPGPEASSQKTVYPVLKAKRRPPKLSSLQKIFFSAYKTPYHLLCLPTCFYLSIPVLIHHFHWINP